MKAVLAVLVAAVALAAPAVASAATVIPEGRTVVEITVIGDDVVLNGTSAGTVIVVGGDLRIGPQGRAMDGVTVVAGGITTAPGGRVDGDVLQLGGEMPDISAWALAGILAGALLLRFAVIWLLWRIAWLLAPWSGAPLVLAGARGRPIRTVVVGALLVAGLSAAAALLAVTVIGLPVAAALAATLLLAAALGVSFVLRGVERGSERSTTVGIALAFPLVGEALLGLAAVAATGALFHHLVGDRPPGRAADPVNVQS